METLETKQLLGYTLEIFEIGEFKEYYDEHTTQFNDFARIRAVEVFPHPRGPAKRYACANCLVLIEFLSVSATNS